MRAPRVTIKRATLEQIRRRLETGDADGALEICREALDDFRQSELRRCRDEAYRRRRAGVIGDEEYRELLDLVDGALR